MVGRHRKDEKAKEGDRANDERMDQVFEAVAGKWGIEDSKDPMSRAKMLMQAKKMGLDLDDIGVQVELMKLSGKIASRSYLTQLWTRLKVNLRAMYRTPFWGVVSTLLLLCVLKIAWNFLSLLAMLLHHWSMHGDLQRLADQAGAAGAAGAAGGAGGAGGAGVQSGERSGL